MPTHLEQTDLPRDLKIKLDILTTYIDGKMKRYNLLYAVNGGAFIVAKLINESPSGRIGHLTLTELAIGAILFTFFMTADMWLWGLNLRQQYCEYVDTQGGEAKPSCDWWWKWLKWKWLKRNFNDKNPVFTGAGKLILGALCLLLAAAWTLAIW